MTNRILVFLVLMLAAYNPALAINKCTDRSGAVSFQDEACPNPAETKQVEPNAGSHSRLENPDVEIVDVSVNKKKTFSIALPSHWQYSIEDYADAALTLIAIENYDEPIKLQMVFAQQRQTTGSDASLLERVMLTVRNSHKGMRKIRSESLKQVFSDSVGQLLTYVDGALAKKKKLADGEFVYMTTGAVVIDGMLIKIKLFTNDLDSENYARALVAMQTIVN